MSQTYSMTAGYTFSEVLEEDITGAKLNRLVSEAVVTSTSGVIETGNIGDSQVTLVKIAPNTMDGTIVKNVAALDVIGGIPLIYYFDVPNTTTNIDVTVTHKIKVTDIWAYKTDADGGVGDFLRVSYVALGHISWTVLDLNITDTNVSRVVQINDANATIPAGGVLRVDPTTATDCSCDLFVSAIRVA